MHYLNTFQRNPKLIHRLHDLVRINIKAMKEEETEDPHLHAWAAGFFDGEGCISPVGRTAGMQLIFSQRVREPVERFEQLYRGSIRVTSTAYVAGGLCYWWYVCERGGVRYALEQMLPFFTVKHVQAELALEWLSLPKLHGLPEHERELIRKRRKELSALIREAKTPWKTVL